MYVFIHSSSPALHMSMSHPWRTGQRRRRKRSKAAYRIWLKSINAIQYSSNPYPVQSSEINLNYFLRTKDCPLLEKIKPTSYMLSHLSFLHKLNLAFQCDVHVSHMHVLLLPTWLFAGASRCIMSGEVYVELNREWRLRLRKLVRRKSERGCYYCGVYIHKILSIPWVQRLWQYRIRFEKEISWSRPLSRNSHTYFSLLWFFYFLQGFKRYR